MPVTPKTEYRATLDLPKKTIVIELEKFSYGKYLFKVTHVPKVGKSKPTNRWYNYGEQPKKYDKYFEAIIDEFSRHEKDRLIEDITNDVHQIYKNRDLKYYPNYTQKKLAEYNQILAYLRSL